MRCSLHHPSLDNRMSANINQAFFHHPSITNLSVMSCLRLQLGNQTLPVSRPRAENKLGSAGFSTGERGRSVTICPFDSLVACCFGNGLIGRLKLSDENSRRRKAACRVVFSRLKLRDSAPRLDLAAFCTAQDISSSDGHISQAPSCFTLRAAHLPINSCELMNHSSLPSHSLMRSSSSDREGLQWEMTIPTDRA